jgi:hypothetical protein
VTILYPRRVEEMTDPLICPVYGTERPCGVKLVSKEGARELQDLVAAQPTVGWAIISGVTSDARVVFQRELDGVLRHFLVNEGSTFIGEGIQYLESAEILPLFAVQYGDTCISGFIEARATGSEITVAGAAIPNVWIDGVLASVSARTTDSVTLHLTGRHTIQMGSDSTHIVAPPTE